MLPPRWACALAPLTRLELPGTHRFLRWAGVLGHANHEHWSALGTRQSTGKWHRLRMNLDLADWSDRTAFFLARYYEVGPQLVIRELLRPGDTFIDVGANIGMMTLLAASRVAPRNLPATSTPGRVYAFEPNPAVFARLSEHVRINALEPVVTLHHMGAADADTELILRVPTDHTGFATFGNVRQIHEGQVTAEYRTPVRRLDDVLPADLHGSLTVKIDVEGFECRVLAGMTRLLETRRPAVLLEADHDMLAHAGSSMRDLFSLMTQRNYLGYTLSVSARALPPRYTPRLVHLPSPDSSITHEIVWLVPGSPQHDRLAKWIQPA